MKTSTASVSSKVGTFVKDKYENIKVWNLFLYVQKSTIVDDSKSKLDAVKTKIGSGLTSFFKKKEKKPKGAIDFEEQTQEEEKEEVKDRVDLAYEQSIQVLQNKNLVNPYTSYIK